MACKLVSFSILLSANATGSIIGLMNLRRWTTCIVRIWSTACVIIRPPSRRISVHLPSEKPRFELSLYLMHAIWWPSHTQDVRISSSIYREWNTVDYRRRMRLLRPQISLDFLPLVLKSFPLDFPLQPEPWIKGQENPLMMAGTKTPFRENVSFAIDWFSVTFWPVSCSTTGIYWKT